MMNIYPEIKKIAGANAKVERLVAALGKYLDTDGLDFSCAYLIDGCTEKNGHLYRNGRRIDRDGLVDNDYYCTQYTGYCEDYYYGTIYFKTNVPGQFVAVPFAT